MAGGAAACSALLTSATTRPAPIALVTWIAVVAPIALSGWRGSTRRERRGARRLLAGGALAVLLAAGVAAVGFLGHRADLADGVDSLTTGLAAARLGDLEAAQTDLDAAAESLAAARQGLAPWFAAGRLVPGLSQNLAAVDRLATVGSDAAAAAADVAGLATSDAVTVRDGAIDLDAVRDLDRPVAALVDRLGAAEAAIGDARRSPLLPPVRHRVERAGRDVERALDDGRRARDLVAIAPELLGADAPTRYLVLLTSPSEARGRFGFPAAYASLLVDDGRLELEAAESIDALLGEQQPVPSEDDDPLVAPYAGFGATADWRSVTIPPDFPTVARLADGLWDSDARGELAGVLRLDTTALAALAGLTGPVAVPGRPTPIEGSAITSYLDLEQYLLFGDTAIDERQEVLEQLAGEVFDRVATGDLPSLATVAATFAPVIDGEHLQVTSFRPAVERVLTDLEVTGRFEEPGASAALVLGGINLRGNKIDALLQRRVEVEVVTTAEGVETRLSIHLRNEAPSTGLPGYVGGAAVLDGLAPGTNNTCLLLWSAAPIDDLRVDGTSARASISATGGWWVHVVPVTIAPGAEVVVTGVVAGPDGAGAPYELEVLPSASARPDELRIDVDGDPVADGPLLSPTRVHG